MFPNLLIFCLNIAFNVLHELLDQGGNLEGGREREREEGIIVNDIIFLPSVGIFPFSIF